MADNTPDDDEVTPRAGELTTANYGWVKPNVGDSDDAWGGMLNADLDGIDGTVKSVSTVANAAYPATNPSGYQTAAQVTAAVPVASSTNPLMDGTAAVGTGTTWARADHRHPSDTSKYDASNPAGYQTAAQVATSVDSARLGDNRIINGDMRIDQRNNGASVIGTAALTYTVDRWFFQSSQASKGSWQRQGVGGIGFPYALSFTSSSAYAPVAGDYIIFAQNIEADMVSDFAWGTASAQPVTLSFWAYSSLAGTHSGSIRNTANTRAYPFSYSLVASTWTKIVVTIPGDTAGTWPSFGNAASMNVNFNLGSGSNQLGPVGAWASTPYLGVTGAVSVVGTNGATFYVTGVKLEIGSVATPYNRQSLAKSMADCQRYYAAMTGLWFFAYSAASQNFGQTISYSVTMRAQPTVAFTSPSYVNASGIASTQISFSSVAVYAVATALGQANWAASMTLTAEL